MSAAPNAAERAAGWPARCSDLAGLKVRLRRKVENGWIGLPAGTVGLIRSAPSQWHRISIIAEPCGHCGVQMKCGGLSRRDLEVINGE